jgi:hypothetical protein
MLAHGGSPCALFRTCPAIKACSHVLSISIPVAVVAGFPLVQRLAVMESQTPAAAKMALAAQAAMTGGMTPS